MNWRKLLTGITLVNMLGWILLEIWINHYSGGVAQWGAFWMILIQLIGYYIVVIASKLPQPEPPQPPGKCEHEWHKAKYGAYEACIICDAERGV